MKSVLGRGISVFGESSCFLFAHGVILSYEIAVLYVCWHSQKAILYGSVTVQTIVKTDEI